VLRPAPVDDRMSRISGAARAVPSATSKIRGLSR
jgi:hypothetical protein